MLSDEEWDVILVYKLESIAIHPRTQTFEGPPRRALYDGTSDPVGLGGVLAQPRVGRDEHDQATLLHEGGEGIKELAAHQS